jgi:uncharacterized protein (TIGR03435 family)
MEHQMKRLLVGRLLAGIVLAVSAMALSPTAAYAQDISGTWQGTLETQGKQLRIVFRITNENNGFRAVGFSPDQGNQQIPVSVAQQGTAVTLTMVALNAKFEGRLAADGASITGTFTQGAPTNLILRRATPETAWSIPEPPPPPKLMVNPDPKFEVATIKPTPPDFQGRFITIKGRTMVTGNTTLERLITFAYNLHPQQIIGAPKWVADTPYDIQGQPEGEGQPSDQQWRTMLKKLMADRFQLTFHQEKRELPAYVLTALPGGHKMNKSGGDPNGLPGMFFRGLGNLPAINANMNDFANLLQGTVLDRPVVDKTGIAGRFDFTIRWTPDETQFAGRGGQAPPAPAGQDPPPGLFTAIQEQLGLKLESTRAPVEVFVIDKVEPPSAN